MKAVKVVIKYRGLSIYETLFPEEILDMQGREGFKKWLREHTLQHFVDDKDVEVNLKEK